MTELFTKIFDKIVIIIVAALFIIGFREMILSDDLVGETFGGLIGLLPFAEEIAEPIMVWFKCAYEVPIVSDGNVFTSIMRLIIMACIQPLAMSVLSALILPIPSGLTKSYELEAYTNTFAYRVKELLLNIFASPLLAFVAAWLATLLMNYLAGALGTVGGVLIGLAVVIVGLGLSTIPLVAIGGMTLGLALLWRLLVTLLPKLVEVTITSTLCIAVYVAVVGGIQSQIILTVGALILWLIVWGAGLKLMMQGIAGAGLSK